MCVPRAVWQRKYLNHFSTFDVRMQRPKKSITHCRGIITLKEKTCTFSKLFPPLFSLGSLLLAKTMFWRSFLIETSGAGLYTQRALHQQVCFQWKLLYWKFLQRKSYKLFYSFNLAQYRYVGALLFTPDTFSQRHAIRTRDGWQIVLMLNCKSSFLVNIQQLALSKPRGAREKVEKYLRDILSTLLRQSTDVTGE